MAQLLDLEPNANASPPKEEWNPDPLPTSFELARRGFGSRFVSPFSLGRLTFQTLKGLRSRRKAQRKIARGGKIEPLLFESAPPTSLNRAITAHRAVAYGHAPLADIKEIKNAFGVTVNDAVLAAATLAVRKYLEARDELPDVPLVCMVPVSLKSDQEKSEFSNKVSTMLVKLPTHLKNPEELIEAVGREASDSKTVFAAIEDNLIPQWLELTPPQLVRTGMRLMSDLKLADWPFSPANLVVSNMMGPPVPLYFGRARVEAVFPMGPVGEGIGLNLTLLSNMGRLDVGVLTCREVVPDPWEIADGFADAVAELRLAAQKKLSPAESAQPSATDREAGAS
jgi:WS/DGAT/MGAT family acyltransferase